MLGRKPTSLITRFECKFLKKCDSECWPWTASVKENIYGKFYIGQHTMRYAHRVSYELYIGPIPLGLNVLHKCDNTLCVNPRHLFLGTQKDNVQDMIIKKRDRRGICRGENGQAKLCAEDVQKIINSSLSTKALASAFRVSSQCISDIKSGRTWEHVPALLPGMAVSC